MKTDEYVVRLKSPGKEDKRIKFKDVIKGEIEMPENILDVVLLKKDGTPTHPEVIFHFPAFL